MRALHIKMLRWAPLLQPAATKGSACTRWRFPMIVYSNAQQTAALLHCAKAPPNATHRHGAPRSSLVQVRQNMPYELTSWKRNLSRCLQPPL